MRVEPGGGGVRTVGVGGGAAEGPVDVEGRGPSVPAYRRQCMYLVHSGGVGKEFGSWTRRWRERVHAGREVAETTGDAPHTTQGCPDVRSQTHATPDELQIIAEIPTVSSYDLPVSVHATVVLSVHCGRCVQLPRALGERSTAGFERRTDWRGRLVQSHCTTPPLCTAEQQLSYSYDLEYHGVEIAR